MYIVPRGSDLSPTGLFSRLLFYRWCLRSYGGRFASRIGLPRIIIIFRGRGWRLNCDDAVVGIAGKVLGWVYIFRLEKSGFSNDMIFLI